jgi:hypothetical protein
MEKEKCLKKIQLKNQLRKLKERKKNDTNIYICLQELFVGQEKK